MNIKKLYKRHCARRHRMVMERQMMSYMILEINALLGAYLIVLWAFLDTPFPWFSFGMAMVAYPYWKCECRYYKFRLQTQRKTNRLEMLTNQKIIILS